MRSNEKDPDINAKEASDNAKIIGTLLNVRPKDIEHILWMNCLVSMHKLSNTVLDADTQLKEYKIEIPYMGVLILKVEGKKIIDTAFEPEDYLLKEINKTISTGESRLISVARSHVGERINQKYKELL